MHPLLKDLRLLLIAAAEDREEGWHDTIGDALNAAFETGVNSWRVANICFESTFSKLRYYGATATNDLTKPPPGSEEEAATS
jgi:hypothetical protein